MKKRTVFLTSLLLVLSMVFMGCGEKPGKDADPITVTFVVNGGSAIEPVEVGEDGLVQLPADPTKEGNKFAGWFTDEALTTAFDETVEITEDITIYAKWIVNTYTVTFETNGGSKVDPATVEYKKTATKPTDPTAEGKYFAGWFTDKELTKVFEFTTEITADITLYAKWTTDPVYSVTIKYNISGEKDGDIKATKDNDYKIAAPSKTRDGYTVKWYSDEACTKEVDFTKPFEADSTIYAKWTVIEYTITYNLDDGTNDSKNPVKYTVESETITLADATKGGFLFKGWFNDSNKSTQITKIEKGSTGNITLYAKWEKAGALYEYTYEPTSGGITLPFNAGGDNYQIMLTGIIPDDIVFKKGDVVKLTVKGSSTIAIPSLQVVLVDNAEDTGSGWGWNVMTGYPEVASSLAAETPFEKTVELAIENDQLGTGSNAHKVVFMASKATGDEPTLYPKDHDYNAVLQNKIFAENEEGVTNCSCLAKKAELETILSEHPTASLVITVKNTNEKDGRTGWGCGEIAVSTNSDTAVYDGITDDKLIADYNPTNLPAGGTEKISFVISEIIDKIPDGGCVTANLWNDLVVIKSEAVWYE